MVNVEILCKVLLVYYFLAGTGLAATLKDGDVDVNPNSETTAFRSSNNDDEKANKPRIIHEDFRKWHQTHIMKNPMDDSREDPLGSGALFGIQWWRNINFNPVYSNNVVVVTVVGMILMVYGIAFIVSFTLKSCVYQNVLHMFSNPNKPQTNRHPYLLSIVTGLRPGAGLNGGDVSFYLHGTALTTDLLDPGAQATPHGFARGSQIRFLLSSNEHLGDIKMLECVLHGVEHDAKWFLSYAIVLDILQKKSYYFPSHMWLNAKKSQTDRLLLIAGRDRKFKLFLEHALLGLKEFHLWIAGWTSNWNTHHFQVALHVSLLFVLVSFTVLSHLLVYIISFTGESMPGENIFNNGKSLIHLAISNVICGVILVFLHVLVRNIKGSELTFQQLYAGFTNEKAQTFLSNEDFPHGKPDRGNNNEALDTVSSIPQSLQQNRADQKKFDIFEPYDRSDPLDSRPLPLPAYLNGLDRDINTRGTQHSSSSIMSECDYIDMEIKPVEKSGASQDSQDQTGLEVIRLRSKDSISDIYLSPEHSGTVQYHAHAETLKRLESLNIMMPICQEKHVEVYTPGYIMQDTGMSLSNEVAKDTIRLERTQPVDLEMKESISNMALIPKGSHDTHMQYDPSCFKRLDNLNIMSPICQERHVEPFAPKYIMKDTGNQDAIPPDTKESSSSEESLDYFSSLGGLICDSSHQFDDLVKDNDHDSKHLDAQCCPIVKLSSKQSLSNINVSGQSGSDLPRYNGSIQRLESLNIMTPLFQEKHKEPFSLEYIMQDAGCHVTKINHSPPPNTKKKSDDDLKAIPRKGLCQNCCALLENKDSITDLSHVSGSKSHHHESHHGLDYLNVMTEDYQKKEMEPDDGSKTEIACNHSMKDVNAAQSNSGSTTSVSTQSKLGEQWETVWNLSKPGGSGIQCTHPPVTYPYTASVKSDVSERDESVYVTMQPKGNSDYSTALHQMIEPLVEDTLKSVRESFIDVVQGTDFDVGLDMGIPLEDEYRIKKAGISPAVVAKTSDVFDKKWRSFLKSTSGVSIGLSDDDIPRSKESLMMIGFARKLVKRIIYKAKCEYITKHTEFDDLQELVFQSTKELVRERKSGSSDVSTTSDTDLQKLTSVKHRSSDSVLIIPGSQEKRPSSRQLFTSDTNMSKTSLGNNMENYGSIADIQDDLQTGGLARRLSSGITACALSNSLDALKDVVRKRSNESLDHAKAHLQGIKTDEKNKQDEVVIEAMSLTPETHIVPRHKTSSSKLLESLPKEQTLTIPKEQISQIAQVSLKNILSKDVNCRISEGVSTYTDSNIKEFASEVVEGIHELLRTKLNDIVAAKINEMIEREEGLESTDGQKVGDLDIAQFQSKLEKMVEQADLEIKTSVLPPLVSHIVSLLNTEANQVKDFDLDLTSMVYAGQYVETIISNAVLQTHVDLEKAVSRTISNGNSNNNNCKRIKKAESLLGELEKSSLHQTLTSFNEYQRWFADKLNNLRRKLRFHTNTNENNSICSISCDEQPDLNEAEIIEKVLGFVHDILMNLDEDELNKMTTTFLEHCGTCKDTIVKGVADTLMGKLAGKFIVLSVLKNAEDELKKCCEVLLQKRHMHAGSESMMSLGYTLLADSSSEEDHAVILNSVTFDIRQEALTKACEQMAKNIAYEQVEIHEDPEVQLTMHMFLLAVNRTASNMLRPISTTQVEGHIEDYENMAEQGLHQSSSSSSNNSSSVSLSDIYTHLMGLRDIMSYHLKKNRCVDCGTVDIPPEMMRQDRTSSHALYCTVCHVKRKQSVVQLSSSSSSSLLIETISLEEEENIVEESEPSLDKGSSRCVSFAQDITVFSENDNIYEELIIDDSDDEKVVLPIEYNGVHANDLLLAIVDTYRVCPIPKIMEYVVFVGMICIGLACMIASMVLGEVLDTGHACYWLSITCISLVFNCIVLEPLKAIIVAVVFTIFNVNPAF